jgi:hypothetical protein
MGLLMSPIMTYHYNLLGEYSKNKDSKSTEPVDTNLKRSSLRKSSLTQFPDINRICNIPKNLSRLGKFIHKFKIKFPVFKKYFISQGVGSCVSFFPVSVDDPLYTQKVLFKDDFANDAFFMSLFYFVTLFAKNDPNFNETYFQNFLFEFFIKNR